MGCYLYHWAFMEDDLNDAISASLDLDVFQSTIVSKNLQFRNKLKIFRTLVSLSFISHDDRAKFDKVAIRMGDYSNDRNMIAHDMFGPSEKCDGVHFFAIKASGTLKIPETDWPVKKFLDRIEDLKRASETLKEASHVLRYSDQLKNRFNGLGPIEWSSLLDPENQASHPIPLDPDYRPEPTIPPKDPPTPEAHEE